MASAEISENETPSAASISGSATEDRNHFCPFEQKAMDTYDEDLSENPFFQSLVASCPELFGQCVLEGWLICVPRRDSLPKYAFTLEDFTHHILKPIRDNDNPNATSKRHWRSGDSNCSITSSVLRDVSCGSLISGGGGAESIVSSFNNSSTCSTSDDNEISSSLAQATVDGQLLKPLLKGNWNYSTLTHINVEVSSRSLILDVEVPITTPGGENQQSQNNDGYGYVQLRKEVLFDETFYTNDRQKYKVLCVGSPLNSKVDEFANTELGIWNLTSLRDCIDFICVKGSSKILETYDAYTKLFLHNHRGLENLPLAIQRNLVKSLYTKCMDYAVITGMTTIPENPSLSDFLLQKLQLATETYVLNGIYRSLISAITSVTSADDAYLNKLTRNLAELHPQDLEIDPLYWNLLSRARYELGRINSYSSPLGKLACMKRTLRYLRTTHTGREDPSVLTTDELIPIWVYLIVKNPLGNWIAQLEFLRKFRFSALEQKDNENSFYVVTLEASLMHLKSGKVLAVVGEDERDIGTSCDLGEAWLYTLHQDVFESSNTQLAEMFEYVRLGNCQRLEQVIEEYEVERYEQNKLREAPKEIDGSLLCHPLCTCQKCSALCSPVDDDPPMIPAVNLTTDEGLTLLHVACIYGRPKIVDFLIGAGSELEAQDSQGMTALHYAASRGHQNALLLLLHAGSNLDPENNINNTPLHLASQNGHEGCVKALIYFAEHVRKRINVSACNAKGDTALHFASRWGFKGIVHILTEHGAAITISNLRHATPIDCAHDIHILKILQRSLKKRALVQSNHGDFINIEMVEKEDCGGIVMLISEPQEAIIEHNTPPPQQATDNNRNNESSLGVGDSSTESKANSKNPSRRQSRITPPNLLPSSNSSAPRSRRTSSTRNPFDDLNFSSNNKSDEIDKCLTSVAEHLKQENDHSDFIVNDNQDYFYDDETEDHHIRTVSVETLDSTLDSSRRFAGLIESCENSRDRDIRKIFNAISLEDTPLALFYLGIPAQEMENPENESVSIARVPTCHPLCPCDMCVAKNAGLGLGLDIQNSEGLTPLHVAVQCHFLILAKILIRYGADVNLQSSIEKKTALDFAIDKGFHDIEDVLIASGAVVSSNFSPAIPVLTFDDCEEE